MRWTRKLGSLPKDPKERVGARCNNDKGPPLQDGSREFNAVCKRWAGHDIPHRSYHKTTDEESYVEWW